MTGTDYPQTGTNTTHQAASTAITCLTDRALEAGTNGQWRNPDVLTAFVATLRAITITTDALGLVRAAAPATERGESWAYAGGEALAYAARHLNLRDAEVTRISRTMYVLTFRP